MLGHFEARHDLLGMCRLAGTPQLGRGLVTCIIIGRYLGINLYGGSRERIVRHTAASASVDGQATTCQITQDAQSRDGVGATTEGLRITNQTDPCIRVLAASRRRVMALNVPV